jgi:hypothetical protein
MMITRKMLRRNLARRPMERIQRRQTTALVLKRKRRRRKRIGSVIIA